MTKKITSPSPSETEGLVTERTIASLSNIFPETDLLPITKITVSVDSISVSSIVVIVTVNEVNPEGTVSVPSPLSTTPLLKESVGL